MTFRLSIFTVLCLTVSPAAAQVADSFLDGDFSHNPSWIGTADRWGIAALDANPVLGSNGVAEPDTIYLITPSNVSHGVWRFRFAWRGVNLSNFNGTRVYLIADGADLTGRVTGYFVQLGTNNSDEVRLYRQDGDPDTASNRVLLGTSVQPLLTGGDGDVEIEVTRSRMGLWTVRIDGQEVILTTDATYDRSTSFGLWVKHTAPAAQSYFFDDFVVEGEAGAVDTTAPTLESATFSPALPGFVLGFSEPLTAATVQPDNLFISGIGPPASVAYSDTDTAATIQALLAEIPVPGEYAVALTGLADRARNIIADTTVTVWVDFGEAPPAPGEIVINEIMYDGTQAALEYIELLNLSNRTIDLGVLRLADTRLQAVHVPDCILPPGEYATLVRDADAFTRTFPGIAFVEVPGWPALNDTGDVVILLSGETRIDSVSFKPSWGGNGVSLERVDPTGPANEATNWGSSLDPRGGTPNRQNSTFEIDEMPPRLVSATPVSDGAALTVVFNETLDPASVISSAFRLSPGTSAATNTALDAATVMLTLDPPLAPGAYTLTVRGVRDAKGNTLGEESVEFNVVHGGVPLPGEVVINEIMYDPEDASEYIEIYNRSDAAFDLSRFRLADDRGLPVTLSAEPVPLEPGQFALLVQDGTAFEQAFLSIAFLEVSNWPTLNNSGDTPTLFFDEVLIDAVPYQPGWGGDGVALERIDPAGSSTNRVNFGNSVDPHGGTPGAINSIHASDRTPPLPHFAEQTADNELALFFGEPLAPSSVAPQAFALSDGRSPSETILLGENERLLLRFDDAVTGPTLSLHGLQDDAGNTLEALTISLAYMPAPGEMVVNEILFAPLGDPNDGLADQPEYLEFFNSSSRTLSLRGIYWTDAPDEDGEADTLRIGNGFFALSPGGYAVVFAGGDKGSTALEAAFPGAAGLLIPLERSSLGLLNNGAVIRVHRADAHVLEELAYDPAWHNPVFRDATGVSLERISPTGPSDDGTNWSSSVDPLGGTPGRPNSVLLASPGASNDVAGLSITPSPFSPDGDGVDDHTAVRFVLGAAASLIRVRIFDARGRHVRTLENARLAGRTGELIWDGLDDQGRRLRFGPYVIFFEAIDAEGGTTEAFKRVVVLARAWE